MEFVDREVLGFLYFILIKFILVLFILYIGYLSKIFGNDIEGRFVYEKKRKF